jgi:hypothetical protein
VVAIEILKSNYPDENHVFVYDNAMTHSKQADNALSARQMPKNPSESFGGETQVRDSEGKQVFGADGRVLKDVRKTQITL